MFDLIIFKQKLKYNLWAGMLLMVAASILLSVESIIVVPGGGFYGLYSKKDIHTFKVRNNMPPVSPVLLSDVSGCKNK